MDRGQDLQELIDIMDRLQVPKEKRPKICPKIEKPQAHFFKWFDWRAVGLGPTDLVRQGSSCWGFWRSKTWVQPWSTLCGTCYMTYIWRFQVHLKTLPFPLLDLHSCLTFRLSPTSRALSPNPKRLWWHVVIWVSSWAWIVCPLRRSCWSNVPSRLGDVDGWDRFWIKQHGTNKVIHICILGMEKLSQKFISHRCSKRFAVKKGNSYKLQVEKRSDQKPDMFSFRDRQDSSWSLPRKWSRVPWIEFGTRNVTGQTVRVSWCLACFKVGIHPEDAVIFGLVLRDFSSEMEVPWFCSASVLHLWVWIACFIAKSSEVWLRIQCQHVPKSPI